MKNTTILHIPHASTVIPEQYAPSFCREVLSHEIDVMTDWFCDELFDCGRRKIVFPVSRLVCDVERFRNDEDEVMADIGMGVTYERTSELGFLRHVTEKERQEILARYYDPHHDKLTKAVEESLNAAGHCLIVDCHSFYPSVLPYELRREPDRPEFCIGTSDDHTPADVTEALIRFLTGQGYRVKVNSPFAGTMVPIKSYRKDKRVKSLMIEVNRGLYMETPGVKGSRFQEIRSVLAACIEIAEARCGLPEAEQPRHV